MPPSSLIRDAALSTGGLLIQGLGRFGYTTIVARVFGPDRFGTVNTLLSLAIIASLLWPTALGNVAGSLLAADRANGRPTSGTLSGLWRSFWLSLLPIGSGFALIAMLGLDASLADTAQFLLLTCTWSAYIMVRGIRMGLGQVSAAALWDLIATGASLTIVALVVVTDTPSVALLPLSVGYAAFAVAGFLSARRQDGRTAEHPGRQATGTVAWNSVALLASNGLIQFTMVFTYASATAMAAGEFAAAIAIATPASMLAQAVSQVLIPRLTQWYQMDPAEAVGRTRRTLLAVSALLTVAFAAVALLTPLAIRVVYTSRYDGAVGYVLALLVGVLLFSIATVASTVLLVTGRAHQSAMLMVASAVVGVATMVVTSRTLEAGYAAATGLAVGTALSAGMHLVLAWRRGEGAAPTPTLG
ncbi:MAG: hypothetical protein J0H73_14075 [Salana multivorans]|uniref:lipopolysaccharide biosynthesis protein n=1 Tax=Salana multivorans TaxID=120377 RepID=UPI0009610C64|nr:hypothetical protein [Salana multivorans]MBN8883428.1 hypothetical protein [Salana multivorans]OJX98345.1 MAG: hypothetical protein BGO96_03955 [Micrococcales bacterium 73-15]